MIVEDEGLVALQIKEGLENMGYTVPGISATGEECLKLVLKYKPDLVLMDIRLKGKMTGIEAARLIRDNFFIPVIFLTAHSDSGTIDEARLTEAYGYVLKPFEEKALKAAIEVALYKARKEQLMREQHNWQAVLSRSTGEAVIICDCAGSIKYINELVIEITQWQPDEIYESHLNEIFQIFDMETKAPKPPEFRVTIGDGFILDSKGSLLKTKKGTMIAIDYTVAPLRNKIDDTVGVIIVFRPAGKDQNQENMIRVEMDKPLQIQKNFLPERNRKISGINADYFFLPNVFGSGDIFNYFMLDSGHFGFYLLDVMGHGFSAALVAITLSRLLLPDIQSGGILKQNPENAKPGEYKSGNLPAFIVHPEEVVRRLNQRFMFESNLNPFFTFIYGIVSLAEQKCLLVRAGHTAPLLQHLDGSIKPVEARGSAIGVLKEMNVEAAEFPLLPGERLFLYSDGLVESWNSRQVEYGTERLFSFLGQHRDRDLHTLVAELEKEISSWRDLKKFDDDIAFIGIEPQALSG